MYTVCVYCNKEQKRYSTTPSFILLFAGRYNTRDLPWATYDSIFSR